MTIQRVYKSLQIVKQKIDHGLCKIFKKEVATSNGQYYKNFLALLGLIVLAVALRICQQDMFPGHRAIWPVLGAVLIISAGSSAWLNKRILSHKTLVGIGLISYPLYLWHWPLLSFCRILGGNYLEAKQWMLLRIVCICIAIILAFLTYLYIERPIRFGKGNKNVKAGILSILMAVMCCTGIYVMCRGEVYFSEAALKNKQTMSVFVENDNTMLEYAPEANKLRFARFKNAHSNKTVAVIGDSHAAAIFPGLSEKCSELGMNTVLLLYRYDQESNQTERDFVINILKSKQDIKYILIFLRGVLYMQGKDIEFKYSEIYHVKNYKYLLQNTVDTLQQAGKKVYIVSENPVFSFCPNEFMRRFSFANRVKPSLSKESVYEHQKDYLAMLDEIKGAEIINGMDVFCPHDKCSMFDENGISFYIDDDHLSFYGSEYLTKNLLEPYLEKIANEKEE